MTSVRVSTKYIILLILVLGFRHPLFSQITVKNIEEIKSVRVRTDEQPLIKLQGYFTPEDGGEGVFELVDKGTETPDNGIYFASDKRDKLWKRVIQNNFVELGWYGIKGDGISNDFQGIQNALNFAYKNRMAVVFPQNKSLSYNKDYKLWMPKEYFIGDKTLELKYGTQLIGAGSTATIIRYTGNKAAITVGKPMNDHQLEYGMAIRDIKIHLVNAQATGIKVVGACGVVCENIIIEGFSSNANRNTIGIHIDGGNASSFFNSFRNIICNHIQTGYKLSGVPPFQTTNNIFFNCTTLGDRMKNSIGYEFDDYCGHGTNIFGGNIEVCDVGIKIHKEGTSISAYGVRFEGNQTDVQFGLFARGSTFVGCMGINRIENKAGGGFGENNFLGCIKEDGIALNNILSATIIESKRPEKIPLVVKGDASQKAATFETQNHLNTTLFQIDQNGSISNLGSLPLLISSGFGSPESKLKAISGSLYLQTDGGPGKTLWVKESGNGTTGWKPK